MARQPGTLTKMAIAFESVYGTPPVSGFRDVPFASTTLGAQQALLDSELLGYGRDPAAPVLDAFMADGDVVVPMDVEALGFWLKAVFGQPVTTGTTPRTHTYQSGAAALPSLAIETQMPQVPRFAMYAGCVADRLSWTMQRSGLLTATVGLIAQNETVVGATAAGSLTALALQRFTHFNGSLTRNAAALGQVVSARFDWSNNLDRIETIRADGRIDGADPSMASLTGSLEMRFADLTLFNQAVAGTPCELAVSYTIGANASFSFTAHAVHLERPRVPINGPGGVQATFEFKGARAVSPARMATAVLVNTVSAY